MYKVVLVDDERLELETLERYVPWEEMGFKIEGTAKNGKEALELTQERCPDIVITDVKMPMMDGVEFASAARARMPWLKIVFLSGYDDFAYVKSALEVQASGYLLKPLDLSELEQLMRKVRDKCEDELRAKDSLQALARQYAADLLQAKEPEQRRRMADDIRRLTADFGPAGSGWVCLVTIDEYSFLSKYVENGEEKIREIQESIERWARENKHLTLRIDERHYVSISSRHPLTDLQVWQQKEAGLHPWITLICDFEESALETLPDVYRRLREQRDRHVFRYGTGHLIVADGPDSGVASQVRPTAGSRPDTEKLHAAVRQGCLEEAEAWLREFYAAGFDSEDSGCASRASFELLDEIYHTHVTESKSVKDLVEDRTGLFNKLAVLESVPWMENTVRKFVRDLTEAISSLQDDRHSPAIKRVKEWIEREYSMPLTIEALSERAFMSPNYLRTIFKEHTGMTVLEYVTRVRMERAADMLRDGVLKIHEISSKVGYENPSHFCAVFHKKKGITPNQYRHLVLRQ